MEWLFELINSTVFPIAMCIILCYFVKYTTDENNKKIDKITDALNNNTIAITKLVEKMEDE